MAPIIQKGLVYAELGLTLPQVGSDYTYIRETFGDIGGFLGIWVMFWLTGNQFNSIKVSPFLPLVKSTQSCALRGKFISEWLCEARYANCWLPKAGITQHFLSENMLY